MITFQEEIVAGIPALLPPKRSVSKEVNRAPKRKDILTEKEKRLALENALRYFPKLIGVKLPSLQCNRLVMGTSAILSSTNESRHFVRNWRHVKNKRGFD